MLLAWTWGKGWGLPLGTVPSPCPGHHLLRTPMVVLGLSGPPLSLLVYTGAPSEFDSHFSGRLVGLPHYTDTHALSCGKENPGGQGGGGICSAVSPPPPPQEHKHQ